MSHRHLIHIRRNDLFNLRKIYMHTTDSSDDHVLLLVVMEVLPSNKASRENYQNKERQDKEHNGKRTGNQSRHIQNNRANRQHYLNDMICCFKVSCHPCQRLLVKDENVSSPNILSRATKRASSWSRT